MSEFNIEVQGGSSVRLPTGGKYCEKDIIVTASGGGGEDDFIGVKYSNYDTAPNGYNLPKTADARSLDKILKDPNIGGTHIQAENSQCLNYMFANPSKNANGCYFHKLEEVYLPSRATQLMATFQNCPNLKNVFGDLSNILTVSTSVFDACVSLTDIPYMPNISTIGNYAFRNCTGLTEITLPNTITSIHTGAFTGCTNITKINCLFAEGSVTGQPWGATNADVVYISEV